MRRGGLFVLALVLLATPASAEVVVRVGAAGVAVEASAAPLSEVLDGLARQTGMEVVYEGSPPRQPITLVLAGRTTTETVLSILEGQGLNYALVADPTGARVQTLIIAGEAGKGTSTGGRASASPRRATRRVPRRPAAVRPEAMDPDYEDLEEQDPFDYDDPALLDDEVPDEDVMPEPPGGAGLIQGGVGQAPGLESPTPQAPTPFPGGQQVFPASPFTPQPTYPQPVVPRPPGSGPDQVDTPAAAPPP